MKRKNVPQVVFPLDTLVSFAIWAALAVTSVTVEREVRQVALWTILLVLSLIHSSSLRPSPKTILPALGRGIAVGLVLSLPVLFLFQPLLTNVSSRLWPAYSGAALFQSIVLVAPFVEEMFFRGLVQRQHGLPISAVSYGAFLTLFFLPTLLDFAVIGLIIALIGVTLGFIYGYVAERYGLPASVGCHLTVNTFLLFLPLLFEKLARWLPLSYL